MIENMQNRYNCINYTFITCLTIISFLSINCYEIFAQVQSSADENERVFEYYQVDKLPQHEGSSDFEPVMYRKLEWPELFHGEGRVVLSFVITADGTLNQIQILSGLCEQCDDNAIRALSKLKKWDPGERNGEIVSTRMYVNVRFQIDGSIELIRAKSDENTGHSTHFELFFPGKELITVELYTEYLNNFETLIESSFNEDTTILLCFIEYCDSVRLANPDYSIYQINRTKSGIYELIIYIDNSIAQRKRFLHVR